MEPNYGSKRIVTGAHYGLRDWLAQRVTAALMVLYTIVLLVQVALTRHARNDAGEVMTGADGLPLVLSGYDKWASIHSAQWMKVLTFVVIIALLYHAWVGMRDIWMDYIKPVGVRLLLQVFTLVWLVGCAGWAVQVLWRL